MKKIITFFTLLVVLAGGAYYYWYLQNNKKKNEGFIFGNGRIEATEIDIATRLPGRIEKVLVDEGDYVEKGQILAVMQTSDLEAEREEARAELQKVITDEKAALAQVVLRESDKKAAQSIVKEQSSKLDAALHRYKRSKALVGNGAIPVEEYDNDETTLNGAKATVASARDQVDVSQAAVGAAKANANGGKASIKAAQAKIAGIEVDIADCYLRAPLAGRIQYRIAQPGEILGSGGKILNLVDLTDVYMTFYLPEMAVGRVLLNDEARIVLDAMPTYIIPARISFVASVAQFTPKTVETQVERQKLVFRVKAKISKDFLQKHLNLIKTGVPGVTWAKLNASAQWPDFLLIKEK